MGANVIEEVPDFFKRILQTGWAVNLDLPDERFDPTNFRKVLNTELLKTSSLSVRMAWGLPCWPMARHKWPISVQLRLLTTAANRVQTREP